MKKFHSSLRALLFLTSVGFTILYLYVGLARVRYPYSLDFIEDNLVMQALRVAQGKPAFVPPNAEYVPQVYMPLYTWIGGLIFKATGVGFTPLRAFSFLATLATAALLYWIARRERSSRLLAFGCAALFLAGYRLVGGWYELARVENLFVILTLAGVAVAIYAQKTSWGAAAAGALLGLSLLTKQNGMFFAAGVGAYLIFNLRWRVWQYLVAFALVGLLPIWLTDRASGGWFSIYVFGIAYASPIEPIRILRALRQEIFGALLLLTMGVFVLVLNALRRNGLWKFLVEIVTEHSWPVFIAAAVFVTVAGRATIGGARQNYIVGYAFLCLTPALISVEMSRWSPAKQQWGALGLPIAMLLQFTLTWSPTVHNLLNIYNSTQFIPAATMRAAGDSLIARIAEVDGPVFVMMHPPYALMAGKEPSVHIQSLYHARWRAREPLPPDLVTRIENQYYALIISDESEFFEDEPALRALLESQYVLVETLSPADSPSTLSGPITYPMAFYAPRSP